MSTHCRELQELKYEAGFVKQDRICAEPTSKIESERKRLEMPGPPKPTFQ